MSPTQAMRCGWMRTVSGATNGTTASSWSAITCVVEAAAKRQISINAHEPVKDTGLRCTYPNWLAREGARGMGYNAWGTPPSPPEHEAMLAFTRMLSGPMDFTHGIFDLHPNERPPVRADMQGSSASNRQQTKLARQRALYGVLYSPLQMAADLPENYEARMDAFQFIKDVEADWEQSIALASEVGEYVAVALQGRKSKEWFVGAATDEDVRDLCVPPSGLPRNGQALPCANLPRRAGCALGRQSLFHGD